MQLQTILNRVQRHQSVVYQKVRFGQEAGQSALEVTLAARAHGKPPCSGCGRSRPGSDRLPQRRVTFVPLWGLAVFFLYAPRRVACPQCGVKVERLPWAEGQAHLTTAYQRFLAAWAKRLSWQQLAQAFRTTWANVFRSVQLAVRWGLAHRDLEGVEALGVDEVQWRTGHHYRTLVYQIDSGCQRLLWIGKERTAKSLLGFFRMLGPVRSAALRFVCSDMGKPYLQVIATKASQAIQVLDRFHIMAKMNKAMDAVRAQEAKRLQRDGYEPVLKHSRWCLLKRPENLTDKQTVKLAEVLRYNVQTVRAYLHRQDCQRFWEYQSPAWAGRFLKEWCTRVMRSKIEPLQKVVRTLRAHEQLLLNWFRAKGTMSSGVVAGLNYNVKLAMRKAYGFRSQAVIEVALYHQLGSLPEPEVTHKFW